MLGPEGTPASFGDVPIGSFIRIFIVSMTMSSSWPTPSVLISKDLKNENKQEKGALLDRRPDYESME